MSSADPHRPDRPTGLRRRRLVTAATAVAGVALLGWSLRLEPGDDLFYVATLCLAAVWALGALASGPLHLGWTVRRGRRVRPVLGPLAVGLGLAAVFVAGALVVREIPVLDEQVRAVLEHADRGWLPLLVVVTAVNGIAEELYFRGALFAAVPSRPVLVTSLAYPVATVATGNPMLVLASIPLGVLCGLQRRATGGLLAPVLVHLAWSLPMLLVLPLLFG